jgi:hypothetical protein
MQELRRQSRVSVLVLVAFSVAVAIAVAGCKKGKVGDACKPGTALCLDDKTQLTCQGGKFISSPCRGAEGCRREGTAIRCDVSGNSDGDVCSTETEGTGGCTADNKALMACEKGAYRMTPCRGPGGCTKTKTGAACDNTIATEGDRCGGERTACSVDGKHLLTCTEGKFVLKWDCRGPAGCKPKDKGQLSCDSSLGEVGDRCTPPGGACSTDGKQMLSCGSDGKMALARVCRGPLPCAVEASQVACGDMSLAEAGDACTGEIFACAVDHKKILRCKDGKFTVEAACRCARKGDLVKCQ